ncbi:phasin family protein [Polaromonas sp. LjRoot131]|uniref:phasin family protein n=1 Tax=Polaromonas sp. LjRoot131 TaxID=3342262 RepID=UPI003ECDBD34
MSTRNARKSASPEAATSDIAVPTLLADAGRQQMAFATNTAAILFRGSEEIRYIQQQAAQQATERHETVAQKLRDNCTPTELMAMQADLLNFDLQGSAKYWQAIAAAMLKTEMELMACVTHVADSRPGEALKPALEAWKATLANAVNGTLKAAAH